MMEVFEENKRIRLEADARVAAAEAAVAAKSPEKDNLPDTTLTSIRKAFGLTRLQGKTKDAVLAELKGKSLNMPKLKATATKADLVMKFPKGSTADDKNTVTGKIIEAIIAAE